MKTWLAAIVALILTVWRWLAPVSKWEGKREAARKRLKEVDSELEEVTLKIVDAKKRGDIAAACPLDVLREQLLKARRDCQHEFEYFERLSDKKG